MCGGALDLNGFYPCSTAAAIARITGQDFGRKLLPLENDTMDDLFQNIVNCVDIITIGLMKNLK